MYQQSLPQNNFYPQYYNMPQYQRLMQLETQQMQSQALNAPMTPAQNTNQYIKGRPVVSIEEARAAQIDLDGSLFVFTDIGNKKIYTKQINLDGTATLNVYSLESSPTQAYITKAEFDEQIEQIKKELFEKMQIQDQAIPTPVPPVPQKNNSEIKNNVTNTLF